MIKCYLFKTRFGWCGVSADNKVIKQIVLPSPDKRRVLRRLGAGATDYAPEAHPPLADTNCSLIRPLKDYFEGKAVRLRYKLDLSGFTDFEKKVYRALMAIPPGAVETYSSIAGKVGIPGGARAVGNALAKNQIPIIIPCHRVVRSDGSVGNFSAIGGPELKKKLLAMEVIIK